MEAVNSVAYWVNERYRMKEGHTTSDPILKMYRFCNVRREDDRVTRWLKKNWRDPYEGHPNMTGAMLLARMINWPPTLAAIGYPDKWQPELIVAKINSLTQKAWSGAYIVSTCGQPMDKAAYVVQTVSNVMGKAMYTPAPSDTLQAVWTRLRAIPGLGAGFIAAQVVADLKYIDPHLKVAEDWWTWAVPGPGSKRGLNRFYGHNMNDHWKDKEWIAGLHRMISLVEPEVSPYIGRIHAQDWQNVMCEWDKYRRVELGQGKPRSRYTPEVAYQV
jgi:hypothetical protein